MPWAIFAYDQDCGSLVFRYDGNVFEVDGAIHSNGNFEVNGMTSRPRTPRAAGRTTASRRLATGSKEMVLNGNSYNWRGSSSTRAAA